MGIKIFLSVNSLGCWQLLFCYCLWLAYSEILSQGFLPGQTPLCLTRRNGLGREQRGSTSSLTTFERLGYWLLRDHVLVFFLLASEPRVGGSDGCRGSVWFLTGWYAWKEDISSGFSAAKVGSFISKIVQTFWINLRAGFLETLLGQGLVLLLMFPFWVYGEQLLELQCQGIIEQIVYIVHSQAFVLLPKPTGIWMEWGNKLVKPETAATSWFGSMVGTAQKKAKILT